MKRSSQWAITRGKSPPMPWTNHSEASEADRDFFDRQRAQKGSAAAIRLWKDFQNYMEIVRDFPEDELTRDLDMSIDADVDMSILLEEAKQKLVVFKDRLEYRAPAEAREFWEVLTLWRNAAGGAERRRVARENK